MRRYTKDRTVQ